MGAAFVGWPLLRRPVERWLYESRGEAWTIETWGLVHMLFTWGYFALLAWALAVLARFMPTREP
jgi:hypothetical protein